MSVGHQHRVSELENFSADHSVYVLFKEDAAGKFEETVPDKLKTAREWPEEYHLVGHPMDLMSGFPLFFPTLMSGLPFRSFIEKSSHTPHVVASVWGMSGVGKSFLVKHIYYKLQVNDVYPGYTFGWVDVSHPLNLMDLSRSLLLDLDPGYLQHRMMLAIEDPILVCREYLHKHECYIVIDDLQSMGDWDLIKAALGLGTPGSSVVVITNEESVAKHCASGSNAVWNVTCLDVHRASELVFKKKVESLDDDEKHPDLIFEEERRIIVHKCGGLPKVICAVVDMYCNHRSPSFIRKDNLVSMLEANAALMKGSLQDLFAWLLSYFRSCPDFLKPCIFYLTIFPLNHTIRRRRLVRRWIAEGYARDNKESTAEENGEMSFSKLLNLSMIQAPIRRRFLEYYRWIMPPLCQVNGFLREYIISRSMEENLVFALKGHSSKNLQRTGRHLAIDESWDRDRNVFESIDFSRLRSLTVFGEWRQFFISEKMRLLHVLDLEGVSSGLRNGDAEQVVKLLPRLKFLSLRQCQEITHLPDCLGDLEQLQTLDIRGTSVVKLRKSIVKLEKLQYIRGGATVPQYLSRLLVAAAENPSTSSAAPMSGPRASIGSWLSKSSIHRRLDDGSRQNGVKVPRGIGRLSNIHTLGVVNINEEGVLEELNNLTQLHKLGVFGINRNNSRKLFSAISGLVHLRSLSLHVELDEDNQSGCLDGVPREIRRNLQSLKLYGPIRELPVWTAELQNLLKLSLQIATLPQEGVDILQSLR